MSWQYAGLYVLMVVTSGPFVTGFGLGGLTAAAVTMWGARREVRRVVGQVVIVWANGPYCPRCGRGDSSQGWLD